MSDQEDDPKKRGPKPKVKVGCLPVPAPQRMLPTASEGLFADVCLFACASLRSYPKSGAQFLQLLLHHV